LTSPIRNSPLNNAITRLWLGKKAEADRGIVLRVFETDGREAQTTVEFLGRKRRVQAVNLLEEQTSAVDQAVWHLKPYEIGTVRLSEE